MKCMKRYENKISHPYVTTKTLSTLSSFLNFGFVFIWSLSWSLIAFAVEAGINAANLVSGNYIIPIIPIHNDPQLTCVYNQFTFLAF